MSSRVNQDHYAKMAKGYDLCVEPLVKNLRVRGMKMFPPYVGMSVLDMGCGTGTHLELYQKAGCTVVGIDSSRAMLEVARTRLTERAELYHGDASRLPFPYESFDLVLAMFLLHAIPASVRSSVVDEAQRVMKKSGRFLVIDYHPGPAQFPDGWLYKMVILFMEFMAGLEHCRNFRDFMVNGGLQPLIAENGLKIDGERIVGGGTAGLYLLRVN
jgi:ubiquinone/menaquinone biosynthesis C-methylase UbiE